jgi:tetratricopeptide (TPR) repeat protein
MLLESDLLHDLGEAYVLTGPLNAMSIPATLQDSLMARLDQLGDVREIAQFGAVIGREFSYEMLQLLSEMTAEALYHALNQLVEAELLYQRGRLPRAMYVFKHALIQDAAYQSLLKSRRQHLHQQLANILETHFADVVSAQPELAAHHYTAAGLYPQAMAAWQQAGTQAFARVAYREASVSSQYAIDALHQLPESEQTPELTIDLLLLYRNAIFPFGDHNRVIELLREAETIAETLEDQRRLGQILTLLCISFISVRALDEAVESGKRALAIAETQAYDDLRIIASVYLGGGYYQQGNYQQVINMLTPIVRSLVGNWAHAYYGLSNTPSVVGRSVLAWSLSELGQFTEGAIHGEDAMSAHYMVSKVSESSLVRNLRGLKRCTVIWR